MEHRAAAGRDEGESWQEPEILNGGDGVAAADDGVRIRCGNRARETFSSAGESIFIISQRAVPENCLCFLRECGEERDGIRPMVQNDLVFDNRIYRQYQFWVCEKLFDIARIRRFRNKRLPHILSGRF